MNSTERNLWHNQRITLGDDIDLSGTKPFKASFNGKIFTCNINNNINILNNVYNYNYNYKQNYILVENIKSNLDLIKFSKMHSELCQYCYQTEKISNTSIQREWSLEIPSKNDHG